MIWGDDAGREGKLLFTGKDVFPLSPRPSLLFKKSEELFIYLYLPVSGTEPFLKSADQSRPTGLLRHTVFLCLLSFLVEKKKKRMNMLHTFLPSFFLKSADQSRPTGLLRYTAFLCLLSFLVEKKVWSQ
ncbi:MAG: hypothetical protein IKC77_07460 [Lentisphaeria bacterium]|nr:hypothetical protein [Lentisphaeria bacterium]